jgi:hypothetical protein
MNDKLFSLPPEGFRYLYCQIFNIYQQNPDVFMNTFFDKLPTMNPKTVRIICYQLYINGITLDQVKIPLPELNEFPLETIMVILKYKFPPFPNGDIFFLSFLDKDYLNFILDVCIHLEINLNHINKSTDSTCLHTAIRSGSLPVVQKLLSHRVNPNTKSTTGISPLFSAIESLELSDTSYEISLEIIRQLRRYGAKIDNIIKEQIKSSSYKNQVNKALSSGSRLRPEYSLLQTLYFSLDDIEDMALLAELDPSIIEDPSLKLAIEKERSKTIFVGNNMLTWPYYIDDSDLSCYLETDRRVIADSPPNSDEVYRLALENLPDKTPSVILNLPTETPAGRLAPTIYEEHTVNFPLSSGPIIPTGYPLLPTL